MSVSVEKLIIRGRHLLWRMAVHRVPEMLCVALGWLAIGTGAIFLALTQVSKAKLVSYGSVFDYFSPFQWGIGMFAVGVAVATAGIIDRTKAPLLCSVLGLIFVGMGLLSLPSVMRGDSVGLIFVTGIGIGGLAWVTMLACLAPEVTT